MKLALARLIGTVVYVGHIRPAPGTWGSLVALPMAWLIWQAGGLWLVLLAIPVAYLKGLWATQVYTAQGGDHDPSEIVIDEVVGQWIALLPVVIGAAMRDVPILALWPGWVAAFVLFRLFDIWKPWLVGQAVAAIGVIALAAVAHGIMAL